MPSIQLPTNAPLTAAPRGFWGMLTSQEQETLKAKAVSSASFSGPLVQHGVPLNRVMIIRSGWAKSVTGTTHGPEVMLRLYGPGDIVGLSTALTGQAPSETVTVVSETAHALVLPIRRFTDFLASARNGSTALCRSLQEQLKETDRFQALRAQAGQDRVAGLLWELCRDRYQPRTLQTGEMVIPPMRLSQEEMASWLGDSRTTVVRALSRLRRAGIIRTSTSLEFAWDERGQPVQLHHKIVINDPRELAELVGAAWENTRAS